MVSHRLEVAKECGADYTLLVETGKSEVELASKVCQLLGTQPDATIDCGGFQDTARLGIQATKAGGVLVLVGMGANEVKVPLVNAAIKEIDIRGVFRYANDYQVGLSLVSSGQVKVKQLVTHKFPIEETNEAFQVARTGKGNPIKVMIYCN